MLGSTVDPLVPLVVAWCLDSKRKRVKVLNRDTGNIQWKTPEGIAKNPERYEKLPQEPTRNPHGRPHRPSDPGKDTLPAPPKIPEPPKPPKLDKPPKPPTPVPPLKPLEPPHQAQPQAVPGLKWVRRKKDSAIIEHIVSWYLSTS